MRRRWIVAGVVFIALAAAAPPAAAADPFVLFLLRMLRDQAISSAIESGVTSAPEPARPPAAVMAPPLPSSEADRVRRLIDESFVHLRPEQREEVHGSLMRILDDPGNAARRGEILAAFTAQAEALRRSHAQLSRLTDEQMRMVAAQARVEFARLPPDQQREMMQALERGVPGMPRSLHELMLAEFRSAAARLRRAATNLPPPRPRCRGHPPRAGGE
jgi:hypothetical protein